MTNDNRAKGTGAEEKASHYLRGLGYTIIASNYQAREGEIDLVVKDPSGTLVFVEVKSSSSRRFGHPFYRITRAKQRLLLRMAQRYLAEHGLTHVPCRFDAIAIQEGAIEHLRNAFFA